VIPLRAAQTASVETGIDLKRSLKPRWQAFCGQIGRTAGHALAAAVSCGAGRRRPGKGLGGSSEREIAKRRCKPDGFYSKGGGQAI